MDNQVILYLKTGHTVKGLLKRPLGTYDLDIEVYHKDGKRKHIFALDEISFIRFSREPEWITADEPTTVEEVQTINRKTFKVAVCTNRKYLSGFFALLSDDSELFRTIFFTFSGISNRHEVRPLGKILQDKGEVTSKHVNEALTIQKRLRGLRFGEIVAEQADISQESVERTIHKASAKPRISEALRVGDILVEAGLVTREQVEKAYEIQKKNKNVKFGEILINQGLITEEQLLQSLATKFCMKFIDLEATLPSAEALGALSEGLVNRLHVFPVELNGSKLVVATSAPTDHTVGDSLRFCANFSIELVVATSRQISEAIDKYYLRRNDNFGTLPARILEENYPVMVEEETEDSLYIEPDSEVIALVNWILLEAYRRGASDIHFEPGVGKNPITIRYRIDGECMVADKFPGRFTTAIISRIKIMSSLDIVERRRPQSGKILLKYKQLKLEFRVELTPIVGGQEAAVLRLLPSTGPLALTELGLMPYSIEKIKEIIAEPYGMILCVGPTGSGKTTTLHSFLAHINNPSRKIWTVEDPVEIIQAGLCQVQVNAKIGYNFADALRSFLRADPDVIMIGEMRDVETAKIAIESSLTGHLVLSTLHTNSATETVVRLIEMGMDPFNFADSLLGILAQRLVRKLCDHCKKAKPSTQENYYHLVNDFVHSAGPVQDALPSYEDAVFMEKTGCEHCGGTGYNGRIAIHELMIGTPDIKQAIREGAGADKLQNIAIREGMWTLRMDGILKVFKGITDLEQINKATMKSR